ncbi:MAG: FlgD immunoglobulin-like domain containing protein [Calditrichaceae bacterium]
MKTQLKFIIPALLVTLLFTNKAHAIQVNSVTVTPNQTNNYAKYDISMRLGNGFFLWDPKNITANVDSIIVVFNSNTVVPSTINPSTITVNNTTANVVNVHGQKVSILTPVNVAQRGTIILSFAESANIKNPSSSGNYNLDAGTSIEGVVTYSSYTISASTSTVSAAAVTPNPSVGGESADYLVSFTTGSGGGLSANTSTITITFPAGTTVPAGALSGVTINGTSAMATATGTTVVVTTPINIDNNGPIDARFAVGSGLKNPATDGTYTVNVKTSSETTDVISNIYTISPVGQLSITAIDTKPAMVNQGGDFIFDFRTGSSGGLSAVLDSIYVIFPQNTFLPNDLSPLNISVISGGFSDNAYAIDVQKSDATDEDTLVIVTPINIGNSTDVTVAFNSSAGYLNPSIAGDYSIGLKTSKDRTVVQSNPYAVFNTTTTISQAIVSPSNATRRAYSAYTVDFNLGSRGRLKPGESTITLTFNDPNFEIRETLSEYDASTITVAQGTPVAIPTNLITPNSAAGTIQVTVPSTVLTNNGDNVVLFIGGTGSDPVRNPNTSKNYNILVKTSVEPTDVVSADFNIGGTAITISSVTVSTPTVNKVSAYTFSIVTTANLDVWEIFNFTYRDYVNIIFPEGTVLPSTINENYVSINGIAAHSVSSDPASRTVTAAVRSRVVSGGFDIYISELANIVNPVVPSASFYKVTMSTSTDEIPVTSSAYTISSGTGQVTGLTASASPAVINASNSVYTIGFTTSATGKLAGGTAAGSSTITIDFDSGTIVPASMTASTVEVNATPCDNLSVTSSGAGGAVQLTVPNGLTIGNSTAATVKFLSNSGLTNGSTAGTYNINVKTSSDNAFADTTGASGNYSILLTQPLFVSSVTPSPTTQNASAGYSVKFTTGSTGALIAGDEIRIEFPSNTGLPATVSKTDVTVNGVNPTVNPTISTNTLIIKTPVSINNLTASTVLLNQAMGVINPTVVGSYTLKVITTAEAGPFTSPTYSITQTTSTVTAANVTPASAVPSAATSYTVNFKVGTNGRLLAGTSTITITYGSATGVSTTLTNYNNSTISVNSGAPVSIASNISVSSKSVIITVPSGVTIGNNANLSIVLDGTTKPITNPVEETYTLQVKTSAEPTNITSNSYAISSTGPVTGITATLTSYVVNATTQNTINFRVGASGALSAGSGTITITFPFNTLVPSSITASNVTVANGAAANPTNYTAASTVTTNSSTRTVTITVPNAIANSNYVSVAFAAGAGIMNPSIFGSYTLKARTSVQPVDGTSAAYTMLATTTTISNLTVTISPAIPSTIARYQYDFQTGSLGRLVSGTSTISLLLPDDATFTQGTPATSKVTVNSTAAEAVVLRTGTATNPDTLIITVPSSVTIGNSSNVSVVIDQSAGLQNASIASNLIYSAYTSVENTPVANSNDTSLPVSLTSFKASAQDGRVILQWETESELENAYWMIEKKLILTEELEKINDGQLDVNETNYSYSLIEKIPGQGNSSVAHSYEYADTSVTAGGIYSYRLADVSITGQITYHSPVIQEIAIPSQFMLGQNYPNPFNPTTTIKYQLATDSKVTLKIYNVLGQEVYTLVNGTQKAGLYKLLWDGRNNSGVKVSSGLYIYRIEADTPGTSKKFSDIKKMVFIK